MLPLTQNMENIDNASSNMRTHARTMKQKKSQNRVVE